jgi:ABC-type polysaccharide/polyol phosphate export permease
MIVAREQAAAAIRDVAEGLRQWRVWLALAVTDIQSRYRRSTIGQFWITISMAVTIVALSIVYSAIFRIELSLYIPLIAVSFIAWALIASLINDGATTFIEAEGYLKNAPFSKSNFVLRMLVRNLAVFAHNLILVPVVMLIFGLWPTWQTLIFIPALLLVLLNGVWLAVVLGTLCARYRDLPPIIASIVQVAFFVSPVMWTKAQLGPEKQYIVSFNHFAAFLELLREPLLGRAPDAYWWFFALAVTAAGLSFGFLFFARFRSRIAYYM